MANEVDTTLINNLTSIKNSKADIKQALIDKGQNPTNVFADYAQLISDIQTGEDLSEELSAQEAKLAQLESILDNKTAGGKVKLNIYAQTIEPTDKDGIWLETNKEFDKIYFRENIVQAENYDRSKVYPNVNITNYNGVVYIKPYIYYLGKANTSLTQILRYNVITNQIETLPSCPQAIFTNSSVYCAINNVIYVFGNNNDLTKSFKYNIDTNTVTQIASCPHQMTYNCCHAIAYNNNIYLIGYSAETEEGKNIYKYLPQTNSYVKICTLPYTIGNGYKIGNICVVGNECFLFNLSNTNHYSYKINLDSGEYTQLSNPPINFECGIGVNQDNYIYIFNKNQSYRYNIINDTFTQLQNSTISSSATRTYAFLYENKIYITGYNNIDCMVLQYKDFENNSIVVSQGNNKYFTELISDENIDGKILFPFNNAYFNTTENGFDNTIPTYYGDGTQWVKFKN